MKKDEMGLLKSKNRVFEIKINSLDWINSKCDSEFKKISELSHLAN